MIPISSKEQITNSQAAVIIINYILASGILTLPRTLVEEMNTPDGWISVFLGGIVATLMGIIMVKLSQRFPVKTFYQYNQDIIGKWAGRLISLILIVYFSSLSALEIRVMGEVTSFFLLEGTPMWAIIIPFIWIGFFLILGGITSIARLFEIILPITIILFLVVSLMSLKIFELDNLRPVLGKGIIPVLKGIRTTTLAFSGTEIMLLLLAFMEHPKKGVKAVFVGVSIPMVFYMTTFVMVIGALSTDGVVMRIWPTISLIRSYELPGLIFERFESLLLVIWIMQIFSSYTITYYAASLGLSQILKKNIRLPLFGLLPVIYILAMVPKTLKDLSTMGKFISTSGLWFFSIIPLLLLIISKVRRLKHEAK
ncbi:GerAB/ArcD/ProY family transporter [Bacillus sp. DNRA2]|uniref:spore germination protein n=1 Tax=Bacillus sp. DNRA2 TaxID=2723053 RepID=UPI00145DDB55|nr:spore germination protein [Bacillus sp. DNRA2]NMD71226.1 GerAB/ArcD/ProY family transporter [Bacillus sp. DNRA2]